MNLQEQLERFLTSKAGQGRAPATLDGYMRHIGSFIAWCEVRGYVDSDLVGATGAEVIEEYQMSMMTRGLSPFTVHTHYRSLRALYHWIERRQGRIEGGSPFQYLQEPKRPDTLPKAITFPEFTLLLHSIKGEHWADHRDRLIIKMLYYTGMRASELLSLRVEDIQLELRRLHVMRWKTSKEEYIPISRSLLLELAAWLGEQRPTVNHGALWPSVKTPRTSGEALVYNGLKQMLRRRCKQAGIKVYRPHAFRHGCAVHIVQRGGDISLVKELLGHRDLMTTQVYLRFDLSQLTSAYDKIFD